MKRYSYLRLLNDDFFVISGDYMDTFFSDKKRWTTGDVAQLLVSHTSLTNISQEDATEFVKRMQPRRVKHGTVLFREGERDSHFMVFILQGEAVVESSTTGHGESMVLKLLGEGDIIGELGIIDNKARSATVTAASDMALAVMDQAAFALLIKEAPSLGCSLLGSLLQSVGNRLRESNRMVHTLTLINKSLHAELETIMDRDEDAEIAAAAHGARPRAASPKPSDSGKPSQTLFKRPKSNSPFFVDEAFPAAYINGSGATPDINIELPSRLDFLTSRKAPDSRPPGFTSTYPV